MRKLLIAGLVIAVLAGCSYATLVYTEQGGAKMVVASGGELEMQSGATLDVQSGVTSTFGGDVTITGASTQTGAVSAESTMGVDGALTAAGIVSIGTWLRIPPETVITVTMDSIITPTGTFQQLGAAGAVNTSSIAAGTAGDILVLIGPASNSVTITDTGTLKLGGSRALSANDTLLLIADGTNWNEVAFVNN